MKRMRKDKGSALALTTVLAMVLAFIGIAFVFFTMYMGGQKEIKNAVDAGALNVGKQALDKISVSLSQDPSEQCFQDLTNDTTNNSANDDGNATLRRINRMAAKALLISLNADAANNDGTVGSGQSNASSANAGLTDIQTRLATELNTQANLYGFFTDYAQSNSVRMIALGNTVQVKGGGGWQTAVMQTGDESNIVINGTPSNNFNMPPNYTLDSSLYEQCTRKPIPSGAVNTYFFKGGTPLTVGGNTSFQVPFQYDQQPRLVSVNTFTADQTTDKTALAGWSMPVPNAFSVDGTAQKAGQPGERALSYCLTNPRQAFAMSMPHSFLHIHVDDMKAKFFFFPSGYPPIEFGPEQTYGYTTDDVTGAPMPAGGILCTTVTPDSVTVGLDVVGRPLDTIIFGPPSGDTTSLENYMVNRINEMISKPGVTKSASDLHSLLNDPATIAELVAGQQDFYIFSTDGENLTLAPQITAPAQATWLATIMNNDPDGTEKTLVDDTSTVAPIFFDPIVTPDPFCSPFLELGWGTWDKSLYWTPGTGYNGCLGKVRVTRWTDVYSLGACNPF